MKEKGEKRISLYVEGFLLLLLSGMVSLLFFMVSNFIAAQQIDHYYQRRTGVRDSNQEYIDELQEYITEQNISSRDSDRLDEWVAENRLIYIQIRKDGRFVYSSDLDVDALQSRSYDFSPYPADSFYTLRFADGEAQAFILGMYSYRAYMVALILEIVASFLLFFFLVTIGIRGKIRYLNQLSQDIEILEGGNMEYEIHIQGNDEITELAGSLDTMRSSLKKQMDEVENLTTTNQKIVTEISHDLRTPLTSVLLYAEILKSGKCSGAQQQEYLDKIVRKIQHMKDLSDRLLEYSVRPQEEPFVPAEYIPLRGCLYDELSDMCRYLEEQGFQVTARLRWEKGNILIHEECAIRILDNISSNILKYADKEEPILIWDEYDRDQMILTFENFCADSHARPDGEPQPEDDVSGGSHRIGIRNVQMMMRKMRGGCEVSRTGNRFRISLRFRYACE